MCIILFGNSFIKAYGNEPGEYLPGLLVRHILAQHGKYGIGSRNGSKDFGRMAHVDVVCQSAGVSVTRLNYGAVPREIERHESDGVAHGNA